MITTFALSFQTFIMLIVLICIAAWAWKQAQPDPAPQPVYLSEREKGRQYAQELLAEMDNEQIPEYAKDAIGDQTQKHATLLEEQYDHGLAHMTDFDRGVLDACKAAKLT